MLTKNAKIIDFFIVLIAVIGLSGAKVANAEVSYHLVRFPGIQRGIDVTDSGVILAGDYPESMLVLPARDIVGNPIWDSNGDGIETASQPLRYSPGHIRKRLEQVSMNL